jgi:hypothetical protein
MGVCHGLVFIAIIYLVGLTEGTPPPILLERSRGNAGLNDLQRVLSPNSVNITATRADADQESVKSTFSVYPLPWFRIRQVVMEQEDIQFRFGVLSIIEYSESPTGPQGLDPTDLIWKAAPLYGGGALNPLQ